MARKKKTTPVDQIPDMGEKAKIKKPIPEPPEAPPPEVPIPEVPEPDPVPVPAEVPLMSVPWKNRMGHDVFHPDSPECIAEVWDDPLMKNIKVMTYATSRQRQHHPSFFLSVERNGHAIDPIALVRQCLAEGRTTDTDIKPEPERESYRALFGAVIAHLKNGNACWLARDREHLLPEERKEERWEGSTEEANEMVVQFHREQAEHGTWPEVLYFDRCVFSREVKW